MLGNSAEVLACTCKIYFTKLSYLIICLQILMDDHHRADGSPVTRFTLHSIYAQSDDEKLQFEYESGNTNIIVRCSCFPPI